jgi:hypothetical protein
VLEPTSLIRGEGLLGSLCTSLETNYDAEDEGGGGEDNTRSTVSHASLEFKTPLTVNDSGRSQRLVMRLGYGKFNKIKIMYVIVDPKFDAKIDKFEDVI